MKQPHHRTGNNIEVREYPSDGQILFKLDEGDICQLLKKDKRERINGKTDYWYKIKHNKKEGWIFGAQTSLKQKERNYSIPKEIKIDKNLDFGMCKGSFGCLIEEFLPIGWSIDDKYFAFATQPENEAIGGYDLNLFIQNMQNDAIVWQWKYNEHKKTNWNEKTREDIVTVWNKNMELFSLKLNEYQIDQNENNNQIIEFPIKVNERTYTVRNDKFGRENTSFGIYEIGSESIAINGENLGSKNIYKKSYDKYEMLLNSKIIGGLLSHNKERIAIIKINEKRGWEGPPNVLSVQLIGCHLNGGFKTE